MRWIITLLFYGLLPLQCAWAEDITLQIRTHSIRATVADTPLSRERGLMHHTTLCENCGMLFVFPKPGKHNFWMKDTPLPLSIAFIAGDGGILNIAEMKANTLDLHHPRGEILYALEMHQSWFSRNGIKAGDRVAGLQKVLAAE